MDSLRNVLGVLWSAFGDLSSLGIKPVRAVLYRQMYFVGIEAIGRMVVMGVLIGAMLVANVANLVGLGSMALTGKIVVWLVVREFGPLFTAFIVITRSVTAIAAELGMMNVTGEIESLEIMGVAPGPYLLMPRIAGLVLAQAALSLYFEFAALFGGYILTALLLDLPFEEFIGGMIASLTPTDLLVSLLKSLCFGLGIAALACQHGLQVGSSLTRIPQAITKAANQGLFLVLLTDALMAFALP